MTFILGTNPFLNDSDSSSGKEKEPQHTNRDRRNAVLDDNNLWPGASIPYEISSVFNGILNTEGQFAGWVRDSAVDLVETQCSMTSKHVLISYALGIQRNDILWLSTG